jgi:ATP-dependent helicase/nuclease subunit A
VGFIEELLTQEQDWAPAEPDDAALDAVRIMSIHRSKGLEFPVVFLADLEHRFNLSSAQGSCLTDEDLGLGIAVADVERNITIKSPTHEAVAQKRRDQDLAEELRTLYVAMTRARERLFLCGTFDLERAGELREKSRALGDRVVPVTVLRSARCVLEWLLLAGPTQVREVTFAALQTPAQGFLERQQEHLAQRRAWVENASPVHPDRLAAIEAALDWSYPYAQAVATPAKQSVTALTHRDDAFATLETHRVWTRVPSVASKPKKETLARIDARTLGTALHRVMETLPLDPSPDDRVLNKHLNHLVEVGDLSESLIEALDREKILAFFAGEVGQACFAETTQVLREWPFTLALPAESTKPYGDSVIVQGIVDMLICRPQSIWVVDFKTDRVDKHSLSERVETYRGQLDLYGRAVETILQRPVKRKVLYFLTLGQEVDV